MRRRSKGVTPLLLPERRFYPKFVDALNNTAQVMGQDFAQHFVDLPRKRLALDALSVGMALSGREMALRGDAMEL
jgi:hypothetical protein